MSLSLPVRETGAGWGAQPLRTTSAQRTAKTRHMAYESNAGPERGCRREIAMRCTEAATLLHWTRPSGLVSPGRASMTITQSVDNFALSIRGGVLRAGDDGFDAARRIWNGMIDRS